MSHRSHPRAVVVALASLLALVCLPASAAGAAPADHGTWHCVGADGKALYTNGHCPAGTRSATPWVPRTVRHGIARSGPARSVPVAIGGQAGDPLLPAGRVDPFIDCRARGGRFDLVGRVCRLPSGGLPGGTGTGS